MRFCSKEGVASSQLAGDAGGSYSHSMPPPDPFAQLLGEIRACTLCVAQLPLGPRPIVRGSPAARLLVISQAPGTRVHQTGLSFDDRSGDRLRQWMGIDRALFYDESRVAVMAMGFCYPGRDKGGGDLPPRPECAPLWHPRLRPHFAAVGLTLLVGGYAVRYYLPETRRETLGGTVARWREFQPEFFVLPHPSWRTTAWEKRNPWFAAEALPELRSRIAEVFSSPRSAPCPRR
jgi:uracil-DNA glycosylase